MVEELRSWRFFHAARDWRGRGFIWFRRRACLGIAARADAVDFAYAVHTEVGHQCVGEMNGQMVSLRHEIVSGDGWKSSLKRPRAEPRLAEFYQVFARAQQDPPLHQRAGARRSEGYGRRLLEKEARHFGRSLKKFQRPIC